MVREQAMNGLLKVCNRVERVACLAAHAHRTNSVDAFLVDFTQRGRVGLSEIARAPRVKTDNANLANCVSQPSLSCSSVLW